MILQDTIVQITNNVQTPRAQQLNDQGQAPWSRPRVAVERQKKKSHKLEVLLPHHKLQEPVMRGKNEDVQICTFYVH